MCYRHDQLDVSSTLTTHLFLGHFHTTTVADDAFVADALILSAVALIVLGRTEDAFAEKSIALGLVGAVGLMVSGFQYFTIGSSPEFLQENAKPMVILVKLVFIFLSVLKAITEIYVGEKDACD